MEQPNLPYWFYSGQLAVTIDGPVYVLKPDGTVVGSSGPAVIVPRSRFFATQRATSHLVNKKLIKRLPDPKRSATVAPETVSETEKKKEAEPVATKSEPSIQDPTPPAETSVSSERASADAVIASDAGEGEAGSSSSVPEEQESSGRRRSRRN